MMELISVIIPVYNVATELPRCLESILSQTYSNIEIVAVNDGSTDNSGAILDKYATKFSNIRVIHKTNGGVTSARLSGAKEAKGEWIGFVDADDEIEPNMYERLLSNAINYKSEISHCGYQMCFEDGRVRYFYNTGIIVKQDKITAIRELLLGERVEPGLWNKLFHKSLIEKLIYNAIMPLDIKINEDLLMNFYLFSAAETSVFEDWCPYHYIVREGSASRKKMNKHKIYDPIKVKKIILEECCEENMCDAQSAFMKTCIYTYCSLIEEHAMQADLEKIRREIVLHNKWVVLLQKRTRLLAKLIIYLPTVFKLVYPVYSKFFQDKKYD